MLVLLAPPERDERWRIPLSAALYFTGLFAKETGAAVIVMLIALVWVRLGGQEKDPGSNWSKRLAMAGGPYVAATGAYVIIRLWAMHGTGVEKGEHSWREVFFTGPSVILFYLQKLTIPMGLSGAYVNPLYSSATMAFWLPLAVVVLLAVLVTWLSLRTRPVVGFSAALILLPILPALATIRVYPQGDMAHDRYLYLPSVGLCLLIGVIAQHMLNAPKSVRAAGAAVLAIVLAAFSVMTFKQQRYYNDDIIFLQRAIEVNPDNAFAYALLANFYMDQGNTDMALKDYRIASEIAPDEIRITLFLARGLFGVQKYSEAEAILNPLMTRTDFSADQRNSIRLSLANVKIGEGNLDAAQLLLEQVEQSDANFPELHWALGVLYHGQGHIPEAQAEFEKEYQMSGDEMARRQSMAMSKQMLLKTLPGDGSR